MSFLQAFRNLPPRTRMSIGLGAIVWSGLGLYMSDYTEKKLGFEASEKDREELKEGLLKTTGLTVVERER